MATDYIELRNSQEYWINKRGKWNGVRRFHSTETNLVENRDALRSLSWTVNSIALLPRRVKVISRDPEQPSYAIIECHYRFSDNPYDYTSGRARMALLSWGKEERMTYDATAGTALAVETKPGTDNLFWLPTKGDNVQLAARSKLIIKTAYASASINWATVSAGIGKVNSAALAKVGFLSIAEKELLLLNAGVPDMFVWDTDDAVVPIRYEFEYRKGGWPDLEAQKYWRGARKEFVMHTTDDPDGTRKYMDSDGNALDNTTGAEYRVVVKDWAIDAPVARVRHATYDFTTLYSLLEWD